MRPAALALGCFLAAWGRPTGWLVVVACVAGCGYMVGRGEPWWEPATVAGSAGMLVAALLRGGRYDIDDQSRTTWPTGQGGPDSDVAGKKSREWAGFKGKNFSRGPRAPKVEP